MASERYYILKNDIIVSEANPSFFFPISFVLEAAEPPTKMTASFSVKAPLYCLYSLPKNTPVYPYTSFGLNHILAASNFTITSQLRENQYSVFTSVPPDIVFDDWNVLTSHNATGEYDSVGRTLVAKLSSTSEKNICRTFDRIVRRKAQATGTRIVFKSDPAMPVSDVKNELYKQADLSYARNIRTDGQAHWPTVVLLTGLFPSHEKLAGDVEWWFVQSRGAVVSVLTVEINRQSNDICVRAFGIPDDDKGRGHQKLWETKVSLDEGDSPLVQGDATFQIPFQALTLREPENGESNWEFHHEDIVAVAEAGWEGITEERNKLVQANDALISDSDTDDIGGENNLEVVAEAPGQEEEAEAPDVDIGFKDNEGANVRLDKERRRKRGGEGTTSRRRRVCVVM